MVDPNLHWNSEEEDEKQAEEEACHFLETHHGWNINSVDVWGDR